MVSLDGIWWHVSCRYNLTPANHLGRFPVVTSLPDLCGPAGIETISQMFPSNLQQLPSIFQC